jgi:predicted XRE-type DNA-binding protein
MKASRERVGDSKRFVSVWDAIADTPEQAANLRARAELMRQIASIVNGHGWTQSEAAARCSVTQPRMNDLLRGRGHGSYRGAGGLSLRNRVRGKSELADIERELREATELWL